MTMQAATRNNAGRIRRGALALGIALLLAVPAAPAQALNTDYPPDGENPLRIIYYFVAPVGRVLEWTVTRPLAAMGSVAAPYRDERHSASRGCSRERPARSCATVVSR